MKKTAINVFFFFLFSLTVLGQGKLKGIVVDNEMNQPLTGVNLAVQGSAGGVMTDIDGKFEISVPASGKLAISFIGYQTKVLSFSVAKGEVQELGKIVLTVESNKLDEVVIKGSALFDIAKDRSTPVAVSTVSAAVIQQKLGNKEFVEILNNTPSVYASRGGGGFGDSRVTVRGFGQENIAIMIKEYGVKTPFEFNVYSNGLATKVKSENFKYDKSSTYSIPIFIDNDGNNKYQLLITFPQKKKFLFSELIAICVLSIIFTLIIIIAYSSALSQLIKQRQISEIKTDFINNMTHEFKTPIATINLALDAIKNPKVIEDKEKVHRYLQMIRDENKRMHAQVENVLRISKLEKKELDISKDSNDIHGIIEDAIEHVNLIIEDREGKITTHFDATRTTVLLNDVHFTNVIVNILDNAIKYSPLAPIIDVYTENVKEFVIIKIKDQGAGMSKVAQKRIFEKFYREHTGDLHNVKGHGLGLAYVKRIVDDHNCQIFVESEKGKGSTFIIKVPLIN